MTSRGWAGWTPMLEVLLMRILLLVDEPTNSPRPRLHSGTPGLPGRPDVARGARLLVAAIVALLWAGGAGALEGIDLSGPQPAAAEGAEKAGSGCSRLVSIKYPFLRCGESGEIGLAEGDATWENSRRLPLQSEWIEGDGAWGPERNLE